MSIFTSFSFIQNAKGICESELFFSGSTGSSFNFLVCNTPYYRLTQDASGTPIQYGYYSWITDSQATFISGTAPDGKNYAVYRTDNVTGTFYILCPVFRTPPTLFYRGQGVSLINSRTSFNTFFGPSYSNSARYIGEYEEWDSRWYPRTVKVTDSVGQLFYLKYPGVCPPLVTSYRYVGSTSFQTTKASACASYNALREFISTKSSLSSITVGDIIYDNYPSIPTNGGNNWVALKLGNAGSAYAFQISSSGVVLAGGIC